MDIGEVLTKAWKIIWKHKTLWLFGILASCSNANGGGSNSGYRFGSEDAPPQFQRFFDQLPQDQLVLIIIAAVVVILILVVLAIFLGTIGKIGLIQGARQVDQGTERLTVGELFHSSTPLFWRVFLLSLLIGLLFAFIIGALVVIGILFSVATLGIGFLCLVPIICVLVPVIWALGVYIEQANLAIVVENLGVMDGLRRGWSVFTANLGMLLVMGLILGLGALIVGLVFALPFLVIVIPTALTFFAGGDAGATASLWVAGICLVLYLPVLVVLNGILTGYVESAWTLTFLRLTQHPEATIMTPESTDFIPPMTTV